MATKHDNACLAAVDSALANSTRLNTGFNFHNQPTPAGLLYSIGMVDYGQFGPHVVVVLIDSSLTRGSICRLLGRSRPPDVGEYKSVHAMGQQPDRALQRASVRLLSPLGASTKTANLDGSAGPFSGNAMAQSPSVIFP